MSRGHASRATARAGVALALLMVGTAGGASAQRVDGTTCVDVRIGDDRYYDCLNRKLRESVPERRFSAGDAPYSATTSPPHVVGGFVQQAVRQRLGTSFGTSLVPQRPGPDMPRVAPLAR